MAINALSQFGGLYNNYRVTDIPKVDIKEVEAQDLKKQQEATVPSLETFEPVVADNRTKSADLENISLSFNQNDDYSYIGMDFSIADRSEPTDQSLLLREPTFRNAQTRGFRRQNDAPQRHVSARIPRQSPRLFHRFDERRNRQKAAQPSRKRLLQCPPAQSSRTPGIRRRTPVSAHGQPNARFCRPIQSQRRSGTSAAQ